MLSTVGVWVAYCPKNTLARDEIPAALRHRAQGVKVGVLGAVLRAPGASGALRRWSSEPPVADKERKLSPMAVGGGHSRMHVNRFSSRRPEKEKNNVNTHGVYPNQRLPTFVIFFVDWTQAAAHWAPSGRFPGASQALFWNGRTTPPRRPDRWTDACMDGWTWTDGLED